MYVLRKTFAGEKLVEKIFHGENFHRENFHGLLVDATKRCHTPKCRGETFANSHKTSKFAEVFSLESFPLYGNIHIMKCNIQ